MDAWVAEDGFPFPTCKVNFSTVTVNFSTVTVNLGFIITEYSFPPLLTVFSLNSPCPPALTKSRTALIMRRVPLDKCAVCGSLILPAPTGFTQRKTKFFKKLKNFLRSQDKQGRHQRFKHWLGSTLENGTATLLPRLTR